MKYVLPVILCATSSVYARSQEPYNANNAVSYARTWAKSRNTATYPDYGASMADGGDCTNFISQVLRAGGWNNTATTNKTSDTLWWFSSKTSHSQTWSTAHGFFRHMNGGLNPAQGFGSSYESWYGWNGTTSVNYGDIVSADWEGDGIINHNMIVTGFSRKPDGSIEPRFSYHSMTNSTQYPDALDRPLSSMNYTNATRFYRWGSQNICYIPASWQIF